MQAWVAGRTRHISAKNVPPAQGCLHGAHAMAEAAKAQRSGDSKGPSEIFLLSPDPSGCDWWWQPRVRRYEWIVCHPAGPPGALAARAIILAEDLAVIRRSHRVGGSPRSPSQSGLDAWR